MKAKKIFWIILGCVSLALGAIGAALPILPTVPFLLLAAFSFAKSSKRLHNWFINTKLYKKNLASYVKGKGMTWPAKIKMMITVTLVMLLGFIPMKIKKVYIPSIILGVVWIFHIIWFIFGIKTYKKNSEDSLSTEVETPSETEEKNIE